MQVSAWPPQEIVERLRDKLNLGRNENIVVYLEVEKKDESTVPAEDKSSIEAMAGSDTVAGWHRMKIPASTL